MTSDGCGEKHKTDGSSRQAPASSTIQKPKKMFYFFA